MRDTSSPGVRHRRAVQGGFSLIEMMVALSVITVALLGIFQVLHTTVLSNVDSRNRAIATRYAERQMETVRNTAFSSINSVYGWTSELSTLGAGAQWERIVTPVGTGGTMVGVRVTVRWQHQKAQQTVSLYTLVHRDGINSIRNL